MVNLIITPDNINTVLHIVGLNDEFVIPFIPPMEKSKVILKNYFFAYDLIQTKTSISKRGELVEYVGLTEKGKKLVKYVSKLQ